MLVRLPVLGMPWRALELSLGSEVGQALGAMLADPQRAAKLVGEPAPVETEGGVRRTKEVKLSGVYNLEVLEQLVLFKQGGSPDGEARLRRLHRG